MGRAELRDEARRLDCAARNQSGQWLPAIPIAFHHHPTAPRGVDRIVVAPNVSDTSAGRFQIAGSRSKTRERRLVLEKSAKPLRTHPKAALPRKNEMESPNAIIISGASSGIGAALARRYIEDGATVGVCGRNRDRVLSVCGAAPRAIPLVFDVTDPAACETAVKNFEEEAGALDLAILNAGYHLATDAAAFDLETCKRIMEINYFGALNCLAPTIEAMKTRRRGIIAMMGSAAATIGLPNAGAYCSSKSAVARITETLRVELRAFNIDVRLITPGFVDTPLTARNEFPMPFLMPVEEAAALIERGLSSKSYEISFPRRLIWGLRLASLLPRALYFKLAERLLPSERRTD